MDEAEFQDCLERARQGDSASLGLMLAAIEDRLRRATRVRIGNRLRGKLHTSDVLQTTYLDVVRSIENFQGSDQATFASWVSRVLENNVRDKAKYYARDRRRDPSTNVQDGDAIDVAEQVVDESTPSRRVMEVEHLHLIGRAFDSLDDLQRLVLRRRMLDNVEYKELAVELDRSEGAVRMMFSRARAALALELDRLLSDETMP